MTDAPSTPMPPMRIPTLSETPLTTRQEALVQALAQGMTKSEAGREAGYTSFRNANRTLTLPNVAARLAHLQAETAARARISIDGICERLMAIVDRMEESGGTVAELNLARRALMDLSKLLEHKGPPLKPKTIVIKRILVEPDGREWDYGALYPDLKPST